MVWPPCVMHVHRIDVAREGEFLEQLGELLDGDLMEWLWHMFSAGFDEYDAVFVGIPMRAEFKVCRYLAKYSRCRARSVLPKYSHHQSSVRRCEGDGAPVFGVERCLAAHSRKA